MGKRKTISVASGIFTIDGHGTESIQEVLDAHAECCAGVHCCHQILILKDQATKERMAGYFKDGVWTTKTLADFKANGA